MRIRIIACNQIEFINRKCFILIIVAIKLEIFKQFISEFQNRVFRLTQSNREWQHSFPGTSDLAFIDFSFSDRVIAGS